MKIKIIIFAGITLTALLPKLLYYASDHYIRSYNQASSYLEETKSILLSKVGLQPIVPEQELNFYIEKYSKQYELDPLLVSALIQKESAENADALSLKGAISYAQIMPANYKRCGLKKMSELWDTAKNIKCGCQILKEELITAKGDLEKALYSYNGGSQAYSRRYPESVNYANKILKNYAQLAFNAPIPSA